MNRKVDFAIIGAQKAGTTTLYALLSQHKDIFLPEIKENPYFINTKYFSDKHYIDKYYKNVNSTQLLGTAHANMLHCSYCPERIYEYNKNMKLIVILRDPISRSFSAYKYAKKNSWEKKANSFYEAYLLEKERRLKYAESRENLDLLYFYNSKYYIHLSNYLNYFDKKQLFICTTNELKKNPVDLLNNIFSFLNVSRLDNIDLTHNNQNRRAEVRFKLLQRILFSDETEFRRIILRILPKNVIGKVRFLKKLIYKLNTSSPNDKENIDDEMHNIAKNYFKDDLKKLKEVYGVEF